jgi:hypothetical protein
VNWQDQAFDYPGIATLNALTAFKQVASQAGASLHRDATDERLIKELLSFGKLGETVTKEPEVPSSTAAPKQATDSDRDGMPDFWELTIALDPRSPKDGNLMARSGYTQLEEYLNWLATPHAVAPANTPVDVDLSRFTRGFNKPAFSVAVPVNGTVVLRNSIARFTPTRNFTGRSSFQFTAVDAEGALAEGTVGVLVRDRTQ